VQSQVLAEHISRLILEKKAYDVVIMDLSRIASFTDFFVICSVDTDVQAKAVMDHLEEQLRAKDSVKPWHVEGGSGSSWLLLDFVDVVVHIFRPESREFYSLEKLWGDAAMIEVNEPVEEKK
jgi:ribosome-associated protein